MYRLVLCLLFLLGVTGLVVADTPAQGVANGVLVQEQVISLPQDEAQWYISVFGEKGESRYAELLRWFQTDDQLKHLREQVHYCRITSSMTVFKERFASNVKGLPTVRVQDAKGVVIYEATRDQIPMTPEGLHGAIASKVLKAQGLCPILPWRRNNVCPQPQPQPQPRPEPLTPTPLDPEPEPLAPTPGPPDVGPMPVQSALPPWWTMALVLSGGFGVGAIQKWRETYGEK